jgi:hypothetical protein
MRKADARNKVNDPVTIAQVVLDPGERDKLPMHLCLVT